MSDATDLVKVRELINGLPVSLKVSSVVTDVITPQIHSVQSMMALIQQKVGINAAKQFAEVVISNKVPDNATELIVFLTQYKTHPVAATALKTLTHSKDCADCSQENTWKPTRN